MNNGEPGRDGGQWVVACRVDQIEPEDVRRFDFAERSFVIVRAEDGAFYAMDGHCSHEKVHLADGLVDGHLIECPLHAGTFDYRNGEARNLPACVDLRTYPVRVEDGAVSVLL